MPTVLCWLAHLLLVSMVYSDKHMGATYRHEDFPKIKLVCIIQKSIFEIIKSNSESVKLTLNESLPMISRSFTPIEASQRTLAAQVQERIRDAILKQTLRPGKRIDQNKLAEELQVSMAPIREALKDLEAEGLVTIYPRRGAFVTEMSADDLDKLYFARALIEGETIFHAVPRLTEEGLERLDGFVSSMRQATDKEEVSSYITLNRQFHLDIYQALDNPHLLQVIQNYWKRSELYRYHLMVATHDTERVHREHEAILDTCYRRDQAAAREAAILHIRHTQEELHDYLKAEIET
jgi:DNA-binding GntR family transcriptional regulator